MSQTTYTEIPDTSDTNYWELKPENNQQRSQTFVPRNKELHHELKVKAWQTIQASLSRSKRKG